MNDLNTERLRIIALNAENLRLLISNQKQLESNLSLNESSTMLNQELKQAMEVRLSKVLMDDKQKYFWHTNWLIVSKDINKIIGGIMIKGPPNNNGEVVIGYYTNAEHQGNGFMTEAVGNFKNWLLTNDDVIYVIADTEKDNIASHKVLEKNNAELYKETEVLFFWRFSLNTP
ncbi:GNAT family N-acetyltransferase [Metasolibacillus meyeri]|uniref:GNAT family N-acetyltransferase n=1 Tax=Metasolibacillus meyeri TaxID=1071052 RepID=UPI000D2FB977|nr:GNAT family N-acetyltransferase [Metasolibacillus meyeri]